MRSRAWVLPMASLLVLLLFWVRAQSESFVLSAEQSNTWSSSWSPLLDKSMSGPLPGLVADFHILDVFSIHHDAQQSQRQRDMQYMATYLQRAQHLDPKFFDVYRLAGSLLAYDAAMPLEAIHLLQQGTREIPDAWEFPFIAGFIAHDALKDDQLAFSLMSQVATREGTPLIIVTLASRFLASATTVEDAILFLRSMLTMVPEHYREGIQQRISELESDS